MEWHVIAEIAPHEDGYDTDATTHLMRRIEAAREHCGEPEEAARLRLVMGDGHTVMRFETCSLAVVTAFHAAPDSQL